MGDLKDDSEVAEQNLDKENKDSYPRTAAGLVTWAMETFSLDDICVGSALKAKGIAAFDPSNWETMMQAVDVEKSMSETKH